MTSQQAQNHPESQTQYSVYVYHYPEDIEDNQTDWEMKRVTHSQVRAIKLAQKYHDTAAYKRVEIKKKYFDDKYACTIDKTMKILEPEQPRSLGQRILKLFKNS